MSDHLDREALLREMHRLFREIGYPGFRSRHFNEAHAIEQWPAPATRERELRACWDSQVEEAYPSYREHFAHVSTEGLAECRDYLRAKLSEPGLDPDTCARRRPVLEALTGTKKMRVLAEHHQRATCSPRPAPRRGSPEPLCADHTPDLPGLLSERGISSNVDNQGHSRA